MKDKLTRKEVLHVAKLARIQIDEDELVKYQVELKKLLDDVDKIKDVKNYDIEKLIAPWQKDAILREDSEQTMLNSKDVLKNAPRHSGNYIEVPIVVSEEI